MCGIVGYLGSKDAVKVIISGLEKLEYRGYDSAGIAAIEGDGRIIVTRAIGKLSELKKKFSDRSSETVARIGIGHTRWATHGRPAEHNAHPHNAGRVSIIHNGIIENYAELKEELMSSGAVFKSETDTEVAAHLLNRYLERGLAPFEALKECCKQIRGSYAFVALDENSPDRLLVAKNATPICLGITPDEVIVASDITAVLPVTRDVVILEDGDIAEIRLGALRIENAGLQVERKPQRITWDPVTAQKGGYKHFMLKEIHEQVQAVSDTFRGRIDLDGFKLSLPEFGLSAQEVRGLERIVFVACGTAWHACLVAKFYFEALTGIPCEVDYASEYRYRASAFSSLCSTPSSLILGSKTLVIAVSQSGETADTLAAIDRAAKDARVAAVCNVVGSSLTRKVRDIVYTQAGPEISVASTKAFLTQLVALQLLALHLGEIRGALTDNSRRALLQSLFELPAAISETLKVEEEVRRIAKQLHSARDMLFLGRGICFPIALEGALKVKELSYIHAEGYPAGEMKHGPLALIDENVPVVVALQRSDALFEKTVSNLKEVESRGGRIIVFTDAGDETRSISSACESIIRVPYISELLSPIVLTVPLQLLAYYVAVMNGTDVDLPRNLAKSVTVE